MSISPSEAVAATTGRVLVVEDEDTLRAVIQEVLEENGCEVLAAASAEEGLVLLERGDVSVALLDLVLPGMNGLQMLGEIKKASPRTEVMMMTSHSSVETVIRAIRQGAYDYLEKPFDDVDEIWLAVRRVLEKAELTRKNEELLEEQARRNEELTATVARLSSLNETSRAMNECRTLDELLDFFAGAVARRLGVDRISLMLVTEDGKALEVAAYRGIEDDSIRDVRMPLGTGIAGSVAESGQHILVTDVASDPRVESSDRASLSNSFISAPIVMSVPIKSSTRVLGVINVTNRHSGAPFTEHDVEHLLAVASQLAVAIERANHVDSLRRAYESLASTQDQLVSSERLKAVGQMAAGVAHDFNNALSVILGRSQMARRLVDAQEDLDREQLASVLAAIERVALQGAEMIRRVQDYTRIRKDMPDETVDLHRVVREAVDMTRPKWRQESQSRGAEIEVRYTFPDSAHVLGNFHELTQVVSNLIFNAVEAMPDGGCISFETRTDDEHVILDVADTGTGMDDETRAHVFEPFYTTKDTGNGLGTSVVYGILGRHGGEISVLKTDAQGTTFRITLPRLTDAALHAPEAEPVVHEGGDTGGPLRILLAEDEDEVRDTYAEALRAHDHDVVAAADGLEAIGLLASSRFDIVVTDHSMPGRTGLDVARAAKELEPPVPVILLSGFAMQEEPEIIRECGVRLALTKPCPLKLLLGKVREAVEGTGGPAT